MLRKPNHITIKQEVGIYVIVVETISLESD